MNEYLPLPTLENLKQQAKRLRAQMGVDTQPITHSQALELLAHQYGYKVITHPLAKFARF